MNYKVNRKGQENNCSCPFLFNYLFKLDEKKLLQNMQQPLFSLFT